MNQPIGSRQSYGRIQPYAGLSSGFGLQAVLPPATTPPPGDTTNTFFSQNSNVPTPPNTFDWLTHLDRQLISPIELFQTSMYKPHQLTQQFITGAGKFQHRLQLGLADQTSRLYRGFEFLTVGNRGLGVAANGRVPGKINLNTIWDADTMLALADPQPANSYTSQLAFNPGNPGDLTTPFGNWFQTFYNDRTKNVVPGPMDNPYKGFATPFVPPGDLQYAAGTGAGISATMFRPGVFDFSTAPHPVQKAELLNKIYNNVTTRSNVFAMWMTIGFFEVIDDTTRPVKLGAEIGLAQHTNTRHRIFAIVDRTNLRTQTSPLIFLKANTTPQPAASPPNPPGSSDVAVDALSSTYEGNPYTISAGTKLLVDVGVYQEIVTVNSVNTVANTFNANFTLPHTAGFLIVPANTLMGNPGPQQNYNPLQDSAVVRYYSIIN
jgi:hypothetical protein